MLARTHLAVTLLFVLLIFSFVQNPLSFVAFSLIATLLADIDSKFSKVGKRKVFRPVQFFLKHRGILHSFIFLFFVFLLLVLFFPVAALPFLLGYGLHLIGDAFTVSGERLFYPSKTVYRGFIKTGGRMETAIFVIFLMADLIYLTSIIFN